VQGSSFYPSTPEEKTEGEVLLSIKAVIIVSKGGLPYFQDRYDDFEFNPTLLAGITSALSTYMDTFMDGSGSGFESMRNAGLIISSQKSDLSNFVVISDIDLSPDVILQMKKSQILLDRKYRLKLDGTDKAGSFMDPIVVYEMFDTAGFKIGFKKVMTFHEDSLQEVMEDRYLDPTMRFQLNSLKEIVKNLPEDNKCLSLEEVRTHFVQRGLKDKEVAKLQVLAYDRRVLRHRVPIQP
jgi:hypothetical protein